MMFEIQLFLYRKMKTCRKLLKYLAHGRRIYLNCKKVGVLQKYTNLVIKSLCFSIRSLTVYKFIIFDQFLKPNIKSIKKCFTKVFSSISTKIVLVQSQTHSLTNYRIAKNH